MSRLIVKNLPTNVTVEKLKEKFSEKGRVTDVQLKYTPDGKFRKFGFVGFQTEEEAAEALKFFHNSYFNTARLSVEVCSELGDPKKPKAWSKYAADSSAYKKLQEKEPKEEKVKVKKEKTKKSKISPELKEELRKHKKDPLFIDFLEAHNKTQILKIVKEIEEEEEVQKAKEEEESEEENDDKEAIKSAALSNISDLEYLKLKTKSGEQLVEEIEKKLKEEKENEKSAQDNWKEEFFTVKIRNLPFSVKKRDIKQLFKTNPPVSIRIVQKLRCLAYVGFKTEKAMRQALIKNKSFVAGKQILVTEYKKKTAEGTDTRWQDQKNSLANEESIAESGRIFVRNLPYTVSEDEVQELFSKYGPVTEINVPVDKISRTIKGFGVITFMMPEHAVAAYTALDGTIFHGRMLHLLPGKTTEKEEDDDAGGFKEKKEKHLKATAGSSYNWNTLFLGQNAVADVIAEKYNASKQDVLTGDDAAVRLALGETQIVNETKQFLEDNGVQLDAFNQVVKTRSKTVILVKNLPAKTPVGEVSALFAKYGELGRVLLPPSGVTAIVEFLEPSEARQAFTRLAYTKFHKVPLYLEWAPENTFRVKEEPKEPKEEVQEEDEGQDDMEPEPETTLFVKNLSFDTTEDSLTKHFSACGKLANVTISRKKDVKNPGKLLSMGYGFVQFYLKSAANKALKTLQGSHLDGHPLELKRSNRTLHSEVVAERKTTNMKSQTGAKILVRNIPFQATIKELSDLFKTFGELKSVRIPRKMVGTGPHRGFGFVEFVTKHDAKRAMKSLGQSTHLYGRRLVLEWAQSEESLGDIMRKTAKTLEDTDRHKTKAKATAEVPMEEDEDEMDEGLFQDS